jgi:hypothetical protein
MTSSKKPDIDGGSRTPRRRTIDKTLAMFDSGQTDQIVNAYRLQLLEDAKDSLGLATRQLEAVQQRNSTILKLAGAVLTVTAVFIVAATSLGWVKLAQFSAKFYTLRAADQQILSDYKLELQWQHLQQQQQIEELEKTMQAMNERGP